MKKDVIPTHSEGWGELNLEWLLEHKSFDTLSPSEKEQVLLQVSEEEYHHMRQFLLMTRRAFSDTPNLKPREDLRGKLHNAMQNKKPQQKVLSILRYPLPVWQVAAAIAMIFIGVNFVTPQYPENYHSDHAIVTADTTGNDSAIKRRVGFYEDSIYEQGVDTL
ncbi:MAG: hypothetical protein AAFW00_11140 [Bacteroidota bacterium]